MALIDEPVRAERLARAILSDILLYHEAELRDASPKLASVVQEGRELFHGRVDPALHAVFERTLAESRLARVHEWASATAELGYRVPPPMPPAAPEPQSSGMGVPVLLGIVALAIATYFYFR